VRYAPPDENSEKHQIQIARECNGAEYPQGKEDQHELAAYTDVYD